MTGPTGRISPVRWQPTPPSPRAALETGPDRFDLTVIGLPTRSSEDVLIDEDGSVLTAVIDGSILRISPDGRRVSTVARIEGRGLGLEFHPDGGLVVCDTGQGRLVRVWPSDRDGGTDDAGRVEVLVADVEGTPMRLCNNASLAADGTIYFTDSSTRFGVDNFKGDLLEHSGTGRLLRRDPDGSVACLIGGLHFPNGVALAADESYLLFAQTGTYAVQKLWLTGPKQGEVTGFIDNLPAFPDNISLGSDGLFWIALPSTRNRILDRLAPRHPLLRRAAWALPESLQPKEARTVFAQAYDEQATLKRDLQQPNRHFYMCSGVRERDGMVWFGSLTCAAVGRTRLDPL